MLNYSDNVEQEILLTPPALSFEHIVIGVRMMNNAFIATNCSRSDESTRFVVQ